MIKRIILFLLISSSLKAKVTAYLGAGRNFSDVGAARLGINKYEVGLLTPESFGVAKLFKIGKSSYATLGIGGVIGDNLGLGMIGGYGFNWDIFGKFGIRGELYGLASTNRVVNGAMTLGASYNF